VRLWGEALWDFGASNARNIESGKVRALERIDQNSLQCFDLARSLLGGRFCALGKRANAQARRIHRIHRDLTLGFVLPFF
jgi:hypothetical protein